MTDHRDFTALERILSSAWRFVIPARVRRVIRKEINNVINQIYKRSTNDEKDTVNFSSRITKNLENNDEECSIVLKRIEKISRSKAPPKRYSHEIYRLFEDRKHILPGWSPSFLRKLGNIQTIIDVGVLDGTPSLYRAYPDAYLILIEALPPYATRCRDLIRGREGEVHMCAAADKDGEGVINHLIDVPARSSMLQHVVGGSDEKEYYKVPQRRLDSLLQNRRFAAETLLKIDTEGMELRIIKGAPELLKQVQYCIVETSVRLRHHDSYRFSDLIMAMRDNGFDLLDVLTVTRPEVHTPGASIMDAIFINSNLNRANPS